MAVTLERPQQKRDMIGAIQRWLFDRPYWFLTLIGLTVTAAINGFTPVWHMQAYEEIARDPFNVNTSPSNTYLYQSPLGPLAAHILHIPTSTGIMVLNITTTFAVLVMCAHLIRRYRSDTAARFFLIAFFCSPLSAMAVNHLGMFDIFTIAAGTLLMIAPGPVCFAAALVAGFNHFEQTAIVFAVGCAVRCGVRRERIQPLVAGGFGLLAGKITLTAYLAVADIQITNSRIGYAFSDPEMFYMTWRGRIPLLLFSVYNVLWVAVAAMGRELPDRQRKLLILTQLCATIPVLLTLDLTRVYAIVTWPIVMLTVLYWAEHPDRQKVQRWAVWVLLAGLAVPRVNVNHTGEAVVSRWDRVGRLSPG